MAQSRWQYVNFHFLSIITNLLLCFATNFDVLDNHINVNKNVFEFTKEELSRIVNIPSTNQEAVAHSRVRRMASDVICQNQKTEIQQLIKNNKDKFIKKNVFENETKFSLALAWAEENVQNTSKTNNLHPHVILAVTTEEIFGGMIVAPSTVYRSDDNGHTFKNITDSLDSGNQVYIQKSVGVQKHATDLKKIILVGYTKAGNSILYVTDDGGASFTKQLLDFRISGPITWHPNKIFNNYMLVSDMGKKELHLSTDGGHSWSKIKDKITKFKWGTGPKETEKTIYALFGGTDNKLLRSTDMGSTWSVVKERVFVFGSKDKFLYASVFKDQFHQERLMMVSTDSGNTWNEAQLPTITADRFYSILDMSEGMIFMHVDNPGDTGHGKIYTSDETGVIFSESLDKHLYPNSGDMTDFYPVKSLKGVYLASQMLDDNSLQTVITFNRGATWQNVRRPAGVPCKDEKKKCYLQIHNMYSVSRGVSGLPPLSSKTAIGIILAHGHVADALQVSPPDVYVTSDGGYNWIKALNGPHRYQIADQGSLLVAISLHSVETNIIKFSTDEGRCWHEYKYTEKPILVTGLLTEPGNKAMHVGIWGFLNQEWRSFIINFKEIITKKCGASDYQSWTAHTEMNNNSPNQGCLLGQKEEFKRLIKDNRCYNDRDWIAPKTVHTCTCTKDDYECDFGYYRPINALTCQKVSKFKEYICLHGHEEIIKTQGYRKIPGDICQGGFTPAKDKMIDLSKHCNSEKDVLIANTIFEPLTPQQTHSGIVAGIVITVIILVAVIFVFFGRKFYLLRKHNVTYRYSMLNQSAEDYDYDNDIENALTNSTSLYHDEEEEVNSSRISNGKIPSTRNGKKTKVRSYHDESDDDLLE